jgi:Xaa-Pro aminopeptidase
MAIFSYQEMQRRVTNLRKRMAENDIDCVIATSYVGSYYLSGVPIHWFGRPIATIIPLEGKAAIVEAVIEMEHTLAQTWIKDVRTYWDFNTTNSYENPKSPLRSMVALVKDFLRESKLTHGRIGIEGADLSVAHHEALRAALPDAQFIDISGLLASLRIVLSKEELDLVRAADAIANLGQKALIEAISVGKSAYEIEMPVRAIMTEAIMESHPDKPFHMHVISGLGSGEKGAGHSEWQTWNKQSVIMPGQLLETVLDVWIWGYWGNVERAVAIGEPHEAMRKPFEVMVEANEAAIAAVKPGARLADVDKAAKDVLSKFGYDTRTGTGCGRGITSYEGNARELSMDLRPYSNVILEPGMAFSIEPDLRVPGTGTFRHCNTIIVTETGCEVDSTLPRGVVWVC